MIEEDDRQLVEASLRGEEKAFERIVEKYQKPLFNAAYRIVDDHDEAEDVTQSAFIKAYENLKSYNPGFKLFSWLYRITMNEALNVSNAKKRFGGLHERIASSEKSGEELAEERDVSSEIERALRSLKLEYRLVIILKHFHDHSYSEMSYILQIPEKTVKSRLFTARNMMREFLLQTKRESL